ncbi:MAG: alanine--tRNA ligase [Rhabdochlamydiaceae bacterium]
MLSQEIRRAYLDYFRQQSHAIISSSSVVPHEDPSLLFTNAGMNQFKDVFLGKSLRDYKTAATSQKCIRVGGKHNDLENVGHTSRHLTFFEMLGNFSFGDYFKEKAIDHAWAVTTEIFQFPKERLWVTVFESDEEALEMWLKYMPRERIVKMGEKDNFWAMGDTGPCGPCSELYFDKGPSYGSASSPKEDEKGERFLEFWNLVFMQFNRSSSGELTNLPKQSIDTGAGLERVISIKMGVDSVFETDILRGLIKEIEKISGQVYQPQDPIKAPSFQVIADHIRSLAFAITDGAQPSNVERGYVLRKLIRRAVRYGRSLGLNEPFLSSLLPKLNELMGQDYPELIQAEKRIADILYQEEENFLRTLKRGGNILSTIIERAYQRSNKQISGEEAFKLKDTYGFPLEEILLIAKDHHLEVDLESYAALEAQAKEKSRQASQIHKQEVEDNLFTDYLEKNGACSFEGYLKTSLQTTITAILIKGQFVSHLDEGCEATILLKETPFYAEKGGQVGDKGYLMTEEASFHVSDCQTPYPGVVAHIGHLKRGSLSVGQSVDSSIDTNLRQKTANNHTATHLLQWAISQVLGPHIKQAGSLVEPNRLRFDFNHHKTVSQEELLLIEELVNSKIYSNDSVKTYEIALEELKERSDIKQFFGEKYGQIVRVVDIDYSKELCGGTHTHQLGSIGLFKIVKESSIAAGVRRIEAVTGLEALSLIHQQEKYHSEVCQLFKTTPSQLKEKIENLIKENKDLQNTLRQFKKENMKKQASSLSSLVEKVGVFETLLISVSLDQESLGFLLDELSLLFPQAILCLANKKESQVNVILKSPSSALEKGIYANELIKMITPFIQGSGGGKKETAQAGGQNPAGIEQGFEALKTFLKTKT